MISQPQPSVPITVGVSYIDGHSGGGGQVQGVVVAVYGVVTVVITVVVPVIETVVIRVVAGGVNVSDSWELSWSMGVAFLSSNAGAFGVGDSLVVGALGFPSLHLISTVLGV